MIDALADFHFIRPLWLLAVVPVIGMWLWQQRRLDGLRGWRSQIDPELLSALTIRSSRVRRWWNRSASWSLIGALFAVVALAGPTWRREPSPFAEEATPLLVLLKAGDTMSLSPPAPSRLEHAKLKIEDLANARRGEPMGLMAYAGSAHLVLPPTKDTKVVATMARDVRPEIMPEPGDRLAAALESAWGLLEEDNRGGSVLIVADSVSDDADSLRQATVDSTRGSLQFLALTPAGTPEHESIRVTAKALGASVVDLTANNDDVETIARSVSEIHSKGVAGETVRWEESGYWLVPVIAVLVALPFRREGHSIAEAAA